MQKPWLEAKSYACPFKSESYYSQWGFSYAWLFVFGGGVVSTTLTPKLRSSRGADLGSWLNLWPPWLRFAGQEDLLSAQTQRPNEQAPILASVTASPLRCYSPDAQFCSPLCMGAGSCWHNSLGGGTHPWPPLHLLLLPGKSGQDSSSLFTCSCTTTIG